MNIADMIMVLIINEFWPYFLLSIVVVIQSIVVGLQFVFDSIAWKAAYRRVYNISWIITGLVATLVITLSSPWIGAGIAVAGASFGLITYMEMKQRTQIKQKMLEYMKAIVGLMNAGMTLERAMSHSVTDATMLNQFPRITDIVRRVIVERRSGTSLSKAMEEVSPLTYEAQYLWEQVVMAAKEFEKGQHGVSADVQLQSINIITQIYERFVNLEREMKREMSQMTYAQWLFVLIIPGLNVYQYWRIDGFAELMATLPGKALLVVEGFAILLVFLAFERIKNLPEIRV